jgi:mono/diheme cytochrome c family protein
LYSTNITPDVETGIGAYTDANFLDAMHKGVGRGSSKLYPAMPYASYTYMSDADALAIKAYLFTLRPLHAPAPPNTLAFPFNQRSLMSLWSLFFNPDTRYKPNAARSAEWNRGAYLSEALAHCGECHTPRNLVLQVKAQTPSQGPAFLSGAVIENYFAPSLRNGGPDTLGGWSESDIVDFLTTGANLRGIVFGSMSDVIVHSTQYLSRDDAVATARYIKTLGEPEGQLARSFAYDDTEHRALKRGDASKPGALLYLDNCAACHRPDGMGYDRVFPRLAGNPVVEAANPISLISIVLSGSQTPRTAQTPAQFAMPAFAWRLNDRDVANLINFIRTSWGNSASVSFPDDVAGVRKAVAPSEER